MTRIVFFGTPREALPALEALSDRVTLVITQPDRPRGRSGTASPGPVKQRAHHLGLPVAQPESGAQLEEVIASHAPFDLGVVVAYGRILRPAVLDVPHHGVLNIHFSLLPRWRGAAPVARALMAGDAVTGVTIIRLDEGLDTGPVLTAQAVDILPEENAGDLAERLSRIGASLLTRALPGYLSGDVEPTAQSGEGVTVAPKIEAPERSLDHDHDPMIFLGRVRALAPTPGAALRLDGSTHKVLEARLSTQSAGPGEWRAYGGGPVVDVGGTGVELTILQPPGKRPQRGEDWVRGRHRASGAVR